jgi:hypothetical protein
LDNINIGAKHTSKNSEECFTFHNTEAKDTLHLNTMEREELEDLKKRTPPLRVKNQNANINGGHLAESLYSHNDFNSVRNSYNYLMQNQGDRENMSMFSNQGYSQTQKYTTSKNAMGNQYDFGYKNNGILKDPQGEIEKVRMLDSRMTEDELYLEQDKQERKNASRNIRKNQVIAKSMLNNSYDDIKQRKKTKQSNNTFRKYGNLPLKPPSQNKHRKQRSISMRSTRNKHSELRDNKISESSDRSIHDRSMSMSLRNEKNEFKDTLKKIRYEDKYKDNYYKVDEMKSKLAKERKKNHEMK